MKKIFTLIVKVIIAYQIIFFIIIITFITVWYFQILNFTNFFEAINDTHILQNFPSHLMRKIFLFHLFFSIKNDKAQKQRYYKKKKEKKKGKE